MAWHIVGGIAVVSILFGGALIYDSFRDGDRTERYQEVQATKQGIGIVLCFLGSAVLIVAAGVAFVSL